MNCEVLAIGTELLLGQVVDTNSSWIGEQLALAGIDCLYQAKVGDNPDRIRRALAEAVERSDAVIVCGGLGPTQDDITRDVIAELMGVPLVRDDAIEQKIRGMFGHRGRDMPANNLRQADVPEGASVIAQQPGTAPGLICPIGDKVVYAVPGVPYEMKEMVAGSVIPDLAHRAGVQAVIRSRTLRTWGHSESGIAELLADRILELDDIGNPTLAFLASGIEGLKIRITAKADDDAAADAILDAEEQVLLPLLGEYVFGRDEQNMEAVVLGLLQERDLTLAVAESVTGGLISARLTASPGASQSFKGGVVSYFSEVKYDLLDVPDGDPVVTLDVARQMADGVRRHLKADIGLGVTGVAGPDEQEGQPVGTVYLGWAIGDDVDAVQIRLPGGRQQIREFACISLLDILRRRLLGAVSARRFVAVWPPDDVLDLVEALHRPVDEGGRWTRRDQWHVTLRFLGDVEPAPVVEALAGVGDGPLVARLGPTVELLGEGVLHVPVAGLDALADDVIRRTVDLGRPPEDRPFLGHLTLARIAGRPPVGVLDQPIEASWTVDEVAVVSSHLGGTAARFETDTAIRL